MKSRENLQRTMRKARQTFELSKSVAFRSAELSGRRTICAEIYLRALHSGRPTPSSVWFFRKFLRRSLSRFFFFPAISDLYVTGASFAFFSFAAFSPTVIHLNFMPERMKKNSSKKAGCVDGFHGEYRNSGSSRSKRPKRPTVRGELDSSPSRVGRSRRKTIRNDRKTSSR